YVLSRHRRPIGALLAAGADLVADADVREFAGQRIGEFHRIGRVALDRCCLAYRDLGLYVARESLIRDRDLIAALSRHNPRHAALLPVKPVGVVAASDLFRW